MDYTSFKVTTPPSVEPCSTTEAKTQLRIDTSTEDTLIATYIASARETLERLMRRAFITQTITLKLDKFPSGGAAIRLPRPPAQSVTSISYVDEDGATQTFTDYTLDTQQQPASILLDYNVDYPSTRTQPNAVTIVYVAGFGDASTDMPSAIILAVKMLIGTFYENREATTVARVNELPLGIQMLIAANEIPEVM